MNYHQGFVASMQSDLFHGQTDRGLIYQSSHSGETRLFNKEKECLNEQMKKCWQHKVTKPYLTASLMTIVGKKNFTNTNNYLKYLEVFLVNSFLNYGGHSWQIN
jgi:hypothetical protein